MFYNGQQKVNLFLIRYLSRHVWHGPDAFRHRRLHDSRAPRHDRERGCADEHGADGGAVYERSGNGYVHAGDAHA